MLSRILFFFVCKEKSLNFRNRLPLCYNFDSFVSTINSRSGLNSNLNGCQAVCLFRISATEGNLLTHSDLPQKEGRVINLIWFHVLNISVQCIEARDRGRGGDAGAKLVDSCCIYGRR